MTIRAAHSLFGLLTAVSFAGGGVAAPFNLAGCEHHDAETYGFAVDAETFAESHSGEHAHASPGSSTGDTDSHGPCSCLGDCTGAAPVGLGTLRPHSAVAWKVDSDADGLARMVEAAPAARTAHVLPFPNAPPV